MVTLEDVRAPVFRALLHFVYTDALPQVQHLVAPGLWRWSACSELLHLRSSLRNIVRDHMVTSCGILDGICLPHAKRMHRSNTTALPQ